MDSMQTTETFQVLKIGADAYIKRRNQRLLSNHRKELRKFTRAEAFTYLDIDAKTLDKWTGDIVLSPAEIDRILAEVPSQVKKDIDFVNIDYIDSLIEQSILESRT